jgi:TolB-like protein/Flp pilus assembly protein TadD
MGAGGLAFGAFLFDRGNGMLLRGGKAVAVGQRGLALLQALADSDGVVSKADLMDAGWPGTIVEEGNLTVQIAALRKVLGTREDGQEWIVTVPRIGYRLMRDAPVAVVAPATTSAPTLPLLAVLPFQNIGGDPEQQYFADGVVDEITMALSRFRSFAVVSRNSSFIYKDRPVDARVAAKELGVQYVLEGSVRRAGPALRINAQLVDGETGAQLWSRRYEGHIEDVFSVEDEVVEGVARVLEPEIHRAEILRSRRERPGSAAAYDLYLRGLSAMQTTAPTDNATAFALFDRAIAIEPENGTYLIHAAWTMAFARAMGWSGIDTSIRRQVDLAHRAVEAAPLDGEVLARATMVLIHGAREYDLAAVMIARGIEANPNSFWVMTCAGIWHLHCGELEQALHYFGRVAQLSANDVNIAQTLNGIAHVHMAMGQYAEALGWAERSLTVNHRLSVTYWMLVAANAQLGRIELARGYLAQLLELAPGTTLASLRAGQPAKIPGRIEPILDGLRLAGLPEG